MAIYKDSFHIPDVSDGEDTLSLVVTPHAFTFQTDDKGEVGIQTSNTGKMKMYLGTTEVRPSKIEITERKNCIADVSEAGTLTIHSITKGQWSGFVTISATYNGQVRTAKIEFVVSAQKYNEAQFETTSGQFKSIIKKSKEDKEGLEQKISTIQQTSDNIKLEVKRQTFGGVNLLKGASLRSNEVSLIKGKSHKICIHETINIRRDNQGHNMHPYLEINVSGKTQDLYSSGRFWTWLEAGKTYIFSMYYKVFGYATSTLSIAVARSNEYTGDATNWLNGESEDTIIKDYNWHRYTRRYAINTTGYYFFAPALQRNGRVFISEVQLEEGTKPTGWHDPDIETAIERTGINLEKGIIDIQTNTFQVRNTKGELTAYVDKDGNFIATTLQTKSKKGNASVYIHDGIIEAKNSLGKTQIKIGINEQGERVMTFYDKSGTFLLDFDPIQLLNSDYDKAASWGKQDCYTVDDDPQRYKSLFTESYNEWLFYQVSHGNMPFSKATFYIYSAPRNGKICKSDGNWSASQTANNDGKAFTINQSTGNFVANGLYIERIIPLNGNQFLGLNPDAPITEGGFDPSSVTQIVVKLYVVKQGTVLFATKTINKDGTIAKEYIDGENSYNLETDIPNLGGRVNPNLGGGHNLGRFNF
jgi:hypothetical protein